MTRMSTAALLTASMLAVVDVVVAFRHPLADVVADVDVAVGVLAAAALHFALAPLALVVGLAAIALWRRTSARARLAVLFAPTVVVTVAAWTLNRELLAHRPAAWLLVAGLPIAHGSTVLALVHPRLRRLAIAVGLLAFAALVGLNAFAYRGVSPQQHVTLVLAAWAFAMPTIFAASRPLATAVLRNARAWRLLGGLSWAAVVVFVVQSFVALADAPAGARLVLRETAPAAHATMDGLGPLLELDGDGDPGWPIGGDCAPFDGAVSPSSAERAGDGIDQNCLAGDPAAADVEALAARIASSRVDGAPPPPVGRLLLITVDALRHDAELPEMEARIGHRCTKVDRAYSTNNETTFAAYSLFASRFPSQGVFTRIGPYLAPVTDPAPRLPGVLGDAGFATMALAFHNRFDPRLGLTTGFAEVWTTEATPEAIFAVAGANVTDRAIAWLADRSTPWMLWAHYYDPHEPYLQHETVPLPELTPRHAYLGEVVFTDRQIARLLDAMGPTLDETALVVTSDHGEAFGEHGVSFHSTDLFDEQIRVPMWVCPPPSWPRAPTQPTASIIDVAPTLLELAGVERPSSFMGRSLLHVADGAVPVFADTILDHPMQAVIAPPWKLVRYLDGDVRLLFDLERDAAEKDDLVGIRDAELDRMSALLDTWAGLVAAE